MIALIDYGAGNLTSVRKALRAVGADVYDPGTPAGLDRAAAIVLPGVGHFSATASLDASWRSAIRGRLEAGVPFLGICLGMQWLFEGSAESPDMPGLGWLGGIVTRLPDDDIPWRPASAGRIKVPHVGWNTIHAAASNPVPGLRDGAYYYFTHTYAAPVTQATAAVTVHGVPFAAAVRSGAVWGVQFHPEKSGGEGLAVLDAFVASSR